MHSADAVPVVLTIFNRPDFTARLVAALRPIRPKRIFVLADAPRPDHPADPEACRGARSAVEAIDWPCAIEWRVAASNLGCTRSTIAGLDWVFDQVDEAVVFDDDTIPAPDFLPWCAAMLDRYRRDTEIGHVSGRNELGRWPTEGADHLITRRGSLWGWATWARSWTAFRASDLNAAGQSAAPDDDQLVADHLASIHSALRGGHVVSWDLTWSLAADRAGRLAVLPPENLIRNIGFGSEATRTGFASDFRGALPTGRASVTSGSRRPATDARFARWALLIELLAALRDGPALLRLATVRHAVGDPRLRLHLRPFDLTGEALAALRHLRDAGTRSPHLEGVLACMEAWDARQRAASP